MMRRDLDRLQNRTFDVLVVGCGIYGLAIAYDAPQRRLGRAVAAGRNRGLRPLHRLPAGRVVSRNRAIQEYPGLRRQGLTGAAVWYDYVMPEPDRLTFAFALAASEHGAILANHVDATTLVKDGTRVKGITARDRIGGREIEIAAQVTINATGVDADRLLQ